MFSLTGNDDKMQVDVPRVVFSSSRPVSPTTTPYKKQLSTPIETLTTPDNNIEAICAELPEKLQLGRPIWHSEAESPEEFLNPDYEVKEAQCINDIEGVLRSPSWSPLSPCFPKHPTSPTEKFTTPQLVEKPYPAPKNDLTPELLLSSWLGTNVLVESEWTIEPSKVILEEAIGRRAEIEAIAYEHPYDPEGWSLLANIYFELCYNDLQVTSAHKAIYLSTRGLDLKDVHIGQKVREIVGMRLSCPLNIIITDELERGLIEAYKALLRGLLEMSAYWDGLKEAKRALEIFPGNDDLLLLQRMMKQEFQLRASALQETKLPAEDIKQLSRVGRSFKRKYPWLEEKLFARPPLLLVQINDKFKSTNCEVRPLFVPKDERYTHKSESSYIISLKLPKQHLRAFPVYKEPDIGPLGVFAKRTIHKDEIILTDYNNTMVPVKPSKKLQHCDACHALLTSPFLPDGDIRRLPCCDKVAYCSLKCASTALNGYHKVLCGKDFKWLYNSASSKELDPSFQPGAFLRIFAIVVADIQSNAQIHPLQHPLLARLTAGYESDPLQAKEQIWNYFSHVIAPTRILAQLGPNVFTDKRWSAEVIHCIYWRILNNACRTSSCTVIDGKLEKTTLSGIGPGYIFFNHSCKSSVVWMAAGSLEGATRLAASGEGSARKKRRMGSEEMEEEDERVRVGCNALLCVATRDIKKGEEARISYLPPGKRSQLGRWFDGGRCICGACNGDLI